jgi:hypothetical protein
MNGSDRKRAAVRGAVLAALAMATVPVFAAEVSVQPMASVLAETSSNVDLDPAANNEHQTQGYKADAAALVSFATPSSETSVKPRLTYQYYPDEKDLNRLEAFLDLVTRMDTPRSSFTMFGQYNHRDEVNAQRSSVEFNSVDPSAPQTTDTARVRLGATRDIFLLAPRYAYKLTQTTSIGVSALYERANYSPDDDSSHVDFDFYQGKGFVGWKLSERTELSIGAYASKYKASHFDSESSAYGGSVDVDFKWSALLWSSLNIIAQKTDTDNQRTDTSTTPPTFSRFKEKSNSWGATWSTTYKAAASEWQGTLGRTISPTGGGGLYETDAIRLQYKRDFTQRLSFAGTAGYVKNTAISRDIEGNDRKYARLGTFLRWMMAPTWFVEGGYEYSVDRYTTDPNSANDNTFSIRFGYLGLPRQR